MASRPDKNSTIQPSVKRALVLGCGGVAGAAWSIAALDNLEQKLGWDARTADILIGTSAGAVLAALLSAGVPVSQLVASQRGELEHCVWDHDRSTGGALPPLPGMAFTGLSLIRLGMRRQVSPLTALCGLAPVGRADMQPFMNLIDSVVPAGEWSPHRNTWIMVVDSQTGDRVALGRADAPTIPLNLAVCGSYAVPGWCPPVPWRGRTYLDGGIASPTSADMLLGTDVEEAIVLAPMASRYPDKPGSPLARIERLARRYMTAVVDREVAALEQAGIRVIRLEPEAEDLEAIGFNMMDPTRRQQVFETAQGTSLRQLAQLF